MALAEPVANIRSGSLGNRLAGAIVGFGPRAAGRRRDEHLHSLGFAAEVGLVLIVMLLMSGISWRAHFVTMLLPYVVLLTFLADARNSGPRRLTGALLLMGSD